MTLMLKKIENDIKIKNKNLDKMYIDKLENTEFIEMENNTIGLVSEDPFIKELFMK